jgi:hypothetical protein
MTASRAAMEVELEHEQPGMELHSGRRAKPGYDCDVCDSFFEGEPAGAGLLVWTRGEEVRYEEPPLCEECALRVTVGALLRWEIEEEEEG